MFVIDCPNCGRRSVSEFRWGGELKSGGGSKTPERRESQCDAAAENRYMRDNTLGVIREWWRHWAGCGEWLIARRHTKTNEVIATYFSGDEPDKSGVD